MTRRRGFTLIELLVVVAIIAILIAILLPALARARSLAKTVICSSRIGQLSKAINMYDNEYNQIPFFYEDDNSSSTRSWFRALAVYVGLPSTTLIGTAEIQKCTEWTESPGMGWIGVNFGGFWRGTATPAGPFIYGSWGGIKSTAIRINHIPNPSRYLLLTDTTAGFLSSPAYWSLQFDQDQDGWLDSALPSSDWLYNAALPRIHHEGTNVGLADGHVEWVPFLSLWKPGQGDVGSGIQTYYYSATYLSFTRYTRPELVDLDS